MRNKRSVRNHNSLMYKLKGAREGNYLLCDPKIFRDGELAIVFYGPRSFIVEVWVKHVSHAYNIKMDWSIAAGRAHVRYIGEVELAANAVSRFLPALQEITKITKKHELIVY